MQMERVCMVAVKHSVFWLLLGGNERSGWGSVACVCVCVCVCVCE